MDVLPHSSDIFEGEDWIGSKRHGEVKIRVEVEECVEDILRGVQELLYDYEDLNIEDELWSSLAESGERVTGKCSHCLSDFYMVEQRCADTYEVTPDYLSISLGEEVLCQSCRCDGKKCESCGVSEKLVKIHCDRNANFSLIEWTFPPQYLCPECFEIDYELFGETWTPEDLNRGDIDTEFEETYHEEFEIDTEGDQGLLDDEETKTTKDIMKEVMDEMFDVRHDISSENTYLNIVNKLQQVYERL